jgi:hypothetical protein
MQMTCNNFPFKIHQCFIPSLSISVALIFGSCDRSLSEIEEETVSWPEINRFDDLAFQADGLARVEELGTVRELLTELLKAGKAVTPISVPSNAADPQQIELILGDLNSLLDGLAAENLDDVSLENLVLGLHPVIAKLIEAAGMPHIHANEGPNSGFLYPVFDQAGNQTGTIEIKLHDDAGDLEVWLKRGGYKGDPWLLPTATVLTLNFPVLDRNVSLAVRDHDRNEDESGASTIVDGNTNYFVFPGETESDASWLMGSDFAAKVELSFGDTTTGIFVLRPHIHRKDEE